MKAGDLLRLVWANLNRMRARAIMSGIGVLIGTAAIMILISLAAGLQRSAQQDLASIGALNEITVFSGAFVFGGGGRPANPDETRLTPALVAELAGRPGVVAVTPREQLLAEGDLQLNRLRGFATIVGVDARQVRKLGWELDSGALKLGRGQVLAGARVGESFADRRRPNQTLDPLDLQGQTLKIGLARVTSDGTTVNRTVRLRVAGVLAERGGQDDYTLFDDFAQIRVPWVGRRPADRQPHADGRD